MQESRGRYTVEMLTRTGPGTPGGDLLRRFWQPVALVRDVGEDPTPVRVMGENLVLFRDDNGMLGLLGAKCAHRCADLSFGRVEDGGLRCVYHGWLFDRSGRCLDQPGEPEGGVNRDKVRQIAYPVMEAGGAVWAYMGPGEPPEFPRFPAVVAPDAYRLTERWHSACNWLQALEGDVDPVHTSYLHRHDTAHLPASRQKSMRTMHANGAPRLSIADTRFGIRIFAERTTENPSEKILRVTNFVMPNACAIAGSESHLGRGGCTMNWQVPIDDESHWRYEFMFHSKKPMAKEAIVAAYNSEKAEGDRPRRNAENRYQQDRRDMREKTYTGMGYVFPVHDLFVTESQGPIHDRSCEFLATSDVAIVRMRRQLLEAVAGLETGADPRGVVRAPQEADFSDVVVMAQQVEATVDGNELCEALGRENIYQLDPAVAEEASAGVSAGG